MKYPLSRSDKIFMWKAARLCAWWRFKGDMAYKRGKVNLANKYWDKGQDWWERGWECSTGG